jgi:hypothetical protein
MGDRTAFEKYADFVFAMVARQQALTWRELLGGKIGRLFGLLAASYFRCCPPDRFVRAVRRGLLECTDPASPLQDRLDIIEAESKPFLSPSYRRRQRHWHLLELRRQVRAGIPAEVRSLAQSAFIQEILASLSVARIEAQLRQPRTLAQIAEDQEQLLQEVLEDSSIEALFPPDMVDQRVRRWVLTDAIDAEPSVMEPGSTAYAQLLKSILWTMAEGVLDQAITPRNLKEIAREFGIPYQDLGSLIEWVKGMAEKPSEEQEELARQIAASILGYAIPKVLGIHYRQDLPLGESPMADERSEASDFEVLASQVEAALPTELERRALRVWLYEMRHNVKFAQAARLLGEPEADIDKLRTTRSRLKRHPLLRKLLQ